MVAIQNTRYPININFKGNPKTDIQKLIQSPDFINKLFMGSIKQNIDVCKQMPENEAISLYDKFKKNCPDFIKTQMDNLYSFVYEMNPSEINSKEFYHATTEDNAKNILTNGFDIFKLNGAKLTQSGDLHRVGNYTRQLGPALYLAPIKEQIQRYGDVILKAKTNVCNPVKTIASFWEMGKERLASQMEEQTQKMGLTLQEASVILNRFFFDFAKEKNIDAIYMKADTRNTLDQLAVYDPKKVNLELLEQ